jgi:hypothetical protein
MPRGDGTGPRGDGPREPRGLGRGQGRGSNQGIGPGGNCVCPACGIKVAHQPGVPCYSMLCPKCGGKMIRGEN